MNNQKLCVFDLDKTLLKINSSFKYFFFLYKKKFFSKKSFFLLSIFFIKYFFFRLSPRKLHEKVFQKFLKNQKERDVFNHVDAFLNLYLKDFINEKVYFFLKKAQKENSYVLLLSNSPEQLVVPIAKRLNIANIKGTRYNLKKGSLDNIVNIMDGEAKANYVLNFAREKNIKNIEVFTDSIWDLPLLKIASKPFVINPDFKLYFYAKKNLWKIL